MLLRSWAMWMLLLALGVRAGLPWESPVAQLSGLQWRSVKDTLEIQLHYADSVRPLQVQVQQRTTNGNSILAVVLPKTQVQDSLDLKLPNWMNLNTQRDFLGQSTLEILLSVDEGAVLQLNSDQNGFIIRIPASNLRNYGWWAHPWLWVSLATIGFVAGIGTLIITR